MEEIKTYQTTKYQKSNYIPIKEKTSKQDMLHCINYSLYEGCFDPTKSSPPNDFMTKLHTRFNQSLGKHIINCENV